MSDGKSKRRTLGPVIGMILLLGGILAVAFIKLKPAEEEAPVVVRPLKTIVVGELAEKMGRRYPGRVRANQSVNLAFEVDGTIIEFPVKKSDRVRKGDLLAKLDQRDYLSALEVRQANRDRTRSDLDSLRRLEAEGAARPKEVSDAEAAFQAADAEMHIAAKALEDTELRARFDGLVADTFADNFENVNAKQQILSLQDVSSVEIEVNAPEERIAFSKAYGRDKYRFEATLDYLPGVVYDVLPKEFSTEADPATQTFVATFVMPNPTGIDDEEGILIFPGMTATITEYLIDSAVAAGTSGFELPVEVVPVDGVGQYYVWVVAEQAGGGLAVQRRDVEVGPMREGSIVVSGGLTAGERIAAAGVTLLEDGQPVRLLEATAESDAS